VNAEGVNNLIRFAKENKIYRFIQISSVVVLKDIKGPYGVTKLEGQKFLEASDLDYTIFIPAMILGPESLGINRILKNVYRFPLIVPLIGYGTQTQHPIFVKDFAKYIVKSLDNKSSFRKTYQIAGDRVIPFRDLIRMILEIKGDKKIFIPIPPFVAKALGKFFQAVQKVPVFTAEHVKGVMQDSRLDTNMLREDLDFSPTPLEEALKYTLEVIDKDWDKYLQPRDENITRLDEE
jgi:NADH dehydrogenase